MERNFKFGISEGPYRTYIKICTRCGESISLGECGKRQYEFTLHHVVKHSKVPVFVNQDQA